MGDRRDRKAPNGPAMREVFPDSVARKKINDRFNWVFKDVVHRDNIYVKAE
jgi:hypothetical protein